MKVLLDECCPNPLQKSLTGTEVLTVDMAGIKGLKNGELVNYAEKHFDVLITADKNFRYQQKLSGRKLAIIELPFNSWNRLQPILSRIQAALNSIKSGQYVEIKAG